MNEEKNEIMLDLLCKKAVYGLSESEARQFEEFGVDEAEFRSLELTAATISMADLKTDQALPDRLQARIAADAAQYFQTRKASGDGYIASAAPAVQQTFSFDAKPRGSMWNWLGWAAAAAACIALAFNIYTTRVQQTEVSNVATPTPTPQQELTPEQKRQRLINSPANVIQAKWSAGNVKELAASVSGDVVWSDAEQAGYLRLQGLPVNDPSKETYQLWIFDENQDPKTPIDGGMFNINSEGEVIIPIDARLNAKNPKAFAVTIEKPGGVVVSKQERVAAIAKRET